MGSETQKVALLLCAMIYGSLSYRRSLHSLRRRLCNRSQLYLLHLHRESIGHLQLGDLPPGECRWLTAAEHRLLYTTCLPHTDMPEQAQSALVTDPCERPGGSPAH